MEAFYLSKDFAETLFSECKFNVEQEKNMIDEEHLNDEFDILEVVNHPTIGIKTEES